MFFTLFHQVFIHVDKMPPELPFLQTEQSQLSVCLNMKDAPIPKSAFGPFLDSLQYVHVSLVPVSPALNPALQVDLSSAEQRGRMSFLHLLATLLIQSNMLSAVFAMRLH